MTAQIYVLIATTTQHFDDSDYGRTELGSTTRILRAAINRTVLDGHCADLNRGTDGVVIDYAERGEPDTEYQKRAKYLRDLDPEFDFGPSDEDTVYSVVSPRVV